MLGFSAVSELPLDTLADAGGVGVDWNLSPTGDNSIVIWNLHL